MKNLSLELDQKAKTLVVDYIRTEGQILSVLIEMRHNKVFADLNYSGIFDYCERALNLSRAQSYYFKSVAEKSVEVPAIKVAVEQGELTLSEARRIVPVITRNNFEEWKDKAKTFSQEELERAVTAVNPQARKKDRIKPLAPELSELKTSIDKETEQDIKALQDLLSQKLGKPAAISDVLKWATKFCREKHDPLLKKTKPISSGNTKVSSGNVKPGRHNISSSLRTAVYQRDQRQCTYQDAKGNRCRQQRWLQSHHIKEVSEGGLNTIDNLRLLCHQHHRWVHSKFKG
jgi:hypothetical protein